jgi:hypothetical protein
VSCATGGRKSTSRKRVEMETDENKYIENTIASACANIVGDEFSKWLDVVLSIVRESTGKEVERRVLYRLLEIIQERILEDNE